MFSERRVSASIDRMLCEPDAIASQSVKTIRKRLEAEFNVTFDTKERSIVKKILTMKIQKKEKKEGEGEGGRGGGSGSGSGSGRTATVNDRDYSVEHRLMMMLGFAPVPEGMGPPPSSSLRKRSFGSSDNSSRSSSSSSSSGNRSSSSSNRVSPNHEKGGSMSGSKRPRVEVASSSKESKEWSSMSLLERAVATKASADAILVSDKLRATPLYVAAQLLMVEHVNDMMIQGEEEAEEEEEEKTQRLLSDVIKTLKFCARTYTKHGKKKEAAITHVYNSVVQTLFMRCRWSHYDVLRKDLVTNANVEKFADMMQGETKFVCLFFFCSCFFCFLFFF